MAMINFEIDFGYKPQGDTEYRTRIYGLNRLKRINEMSMNENELVLNTCAFPPLTSPTVNHVAGNQSDIYIVTAPTPQLF
jgi:hypothetical protein